MQKQKTTNKISKIKEESLKIANLITQIGYKQQESINE